MPTFSLKLPEALATKLEAASEVVGVTRSELVRRALEAFLEQPEHSARSGFMGLARDLLGSLEGPPDLSSNPSYLRDYGR